MTARTLRLCACAALATVGAAYGGTVREDGFADCLAQVLAPCFAALARAEALRAIDLATGLGMLLEKARREYAVGGEAATRELVRVATTLLQHLAGLEVDAGRTHIAMIWAQLGDADAAFAAADNIKDADTHSLTFSLLAGEAIKHDRRDKAQQWLQEVRPVWRADLALMLAAAHAVAGDLEAAVTSAAAALAGGAAGGALLSRFGEAIAGSTAATARFAAGLTEVRQLSAFQRGVASGLAGQGQLAEAATVAAAIREPTEHQGALGAIAFAQLSVGDVDGALRTVAPVAGSVPEVLDAAAIALVDSGRRDAALALVAGRPHPTTADRLRRKIADAAARHGDINALLWIVAEMQESESRPEAWNNIVEARIAANDKAGARSVLDTILATGAELQPMYCPEVRRAIVALAQLGDASLALAVAHHLAYAGDRAHTLTYAAAAAAADDPTARVLIDGAAWAADGLDAFARDEVLTKILRLRLRLDDRPEAVSAYAALSSHGQLGALVTLAYPAQR